MRNTVGTLATKGGCPMNRHRWLDEIERLDPETRYADIYRISSQYEFPWDMTQSLSFALYRTYAVPSIGGLLAATGELTKRAQKRYDDTVLILEAVLEHGFDSGPGRAAISRMNQMHRRYAISADDFLYVLATFVVVPKRWIDDYGWRRHSPHEIRATVLYYREVGRRMGLKGVPETFAGFERLMVDHEREHFGFDQGGRDVSDATLDLMASWYPGRSLGVMRLASICLMDDHLRETFGYAEPPALVRGAVRVGMRLRGRVVRLLPPRRKPRFARDGRQVKGYPDGYDISRLGTFASDCPFPHA